MMEYGASATMILLNLSGCFFVVSTIFQTVKNGLQSLIPGELEGKILPIILSVLELIFNKISSFWFFRYLRPIKKRIPTPVRNFFFWLFGCFPGNESTEITLVIDEVVDGHTSNLMFEASELFLRSKITFSMDKLKIRKIEREKKLLISAEDGQYIYDDFHDIPISWKLNSSSDKDSNTDSNKNRYFELSFEKEFYDTVFNSYLSHVLDRATAIKEENKILKLYSLGIDGDRDSGWLWGSVKLDHPSTFETLAMDSKLKADLLEDLDRFVKRREFYKRVGKAWKRGYLLYGPPGTGKSSLIAAMANHLGFHIYDLELGSVYSNKQFRKLLVATANRSILVIEDIDCTVELQDRSNCKKKRKSKPGNNLSLSGLLNFIDGLWSSVGDERIIICTTNHKDKLDPALLRPGRMDMHINMSYMTPSGFKTLVYNYLKINDHILFKELEKLIEEVNVTPAEIAEELMKSDVVDIALKGLVEFLQGKRTKVGESKTEVEKKDDEESQKEKIKNKKKNKKIKKKKK